MRERVVRLTVVTESVVDGLPVRELVPDSLRFLENVFVFKLQLLNGIKSIKLKSPLCQNEDQLTLSGFG